MNQAKEQSEHDSALEPLPAEFTYLVEVPIQKSK